MWSMYSTKGVTSMDRSMKLAPSIGDERSIALTRAEAENPFLDTFDCPDPSATHPQARSDHDSTSIAHIV